MHHTLHSAYIRRAVKENQQVKDERSNKWA